MIEHSLIVGMCCYNNSFGLKYIFNNLIEISKNCNKVKFIFCYDDSNDDTLELITNFSSSYNSDIIQNKYHKTESRTNNIANARNTILEHIESNYKDYDFFSMMDTNEYACIGNININILVETFDNTQHWDSISFNREAGYYDYWALSFSPYIYSFFHINNSIKVVKNMRKDFSDILKNNNYIYVYSAFNGFAIYKMNKFIDCRYSSDIDIQLFPIKELHKFCMHNKCKILNNFSNDCEHRKFHLESIKKHNSKILIYNKSLFKKLEIPIPNLRGSA
jgi:hypothetical protein